MSRIDPAQQALLDQYQAALVDIGRLVSVMQAFLDSTKLSKESKSRVMEGWLLFMMTQNNMRG